MHKSKFEILLDKGIDLALGFYDRTLEFLSGGQPSIAGCFKRWTIFVVWFNVTSVVIGVLIFHQEVINLHKHFFISNKSEKNICEKYIKEHIEDKSTIETINLKSK